MKKIVALCIAPVLFSFLSIQTYTLKGKITNEKGQPIASASIIIRNTKIAGTSDAQGHFSLSGINGSETLVVSALGFVQQEIRIKNRKDLSIVMVADPQPLQEVVVSAYSVESKRRMVGAAAPTNYYANHELSDQWRKDNEFNREGYEYTPENEFKKVSDDPLSTFSIDVDAASYTNVRRMLKQGIMPPAGAVRIEEMINYFKYDYAKPKDHPFQISSEMNDCPWNNKHKLLLIGLEAKKVKTENLPAANLVFLIDVSGSMMSPQKLPLVKESLKLLTDQLREEDRVAIVVYAGNAGLVLPSTTGDDKETIISAIDALEAGGSTAGGAGIQLAYKTAVENFIATGNNRVILCTDGDFNVGASSDDALTRMIEEKRNSGVYLTVLGYGMGNYQDAKMQKLADKGNGNHHYIDGIKEAKKVLVNEFGGTLFTIAKDVKLQVEFNPGHVQGYRLIGYENRILAKEDFNDDKKDAGEMGSGHTVTALYEIIPVGAEAPELKLVDPLKYQKEKTKTTGERSEWANIKVRYKQPDQQTSVKFDLPVRSDKKEASANFLLASSVAEFGMLLKNSNFKGDAGYTHLMNRIEKLDDDRTDEYVKELKELISTAKTITDKTLADRKK